MCTCPAKSGPRRVTTVHVGEKQLQTWHVLNVHKRKRKTCIFGERIQSLKG